MHTLIMKHVVIYSFESHIKGSITLPIFMITLHLIVKGERVPHVKYIEEHLILIILNSFTAGGL